MKIAFVAGPFIGKNAWDIELNIRRAEEIAVQLWQRGLAVICPHTNSRFFFGAAKESYFLNGYRTIVKTCDLMVLVPGWENSNGTKDEIGTALEADIPIYEWESKRRLFIDNIDGKQAFGLRHYQQDNLNGFLS